MTNIEIIKNKVDAANNDANSESYKFKIEQVLPSLHDTKGVTIMSLSYNDKMFHQCRWDATADVELYARTFIKLMKNQSLEYLRNHPLIIREKQYVR